MVSIHIKLFTTCTSTCKYSKDVQCDVKDFVGIFLCDMDYFEFQVKTVDLVLSGTVVTGKERLMRMPNIQYVCLSGSEVILTLSSYHFCWILSSLNSFSLPKNCSTGYSIRKDVCVLTLLCSGWGCWAGLHSWRSITLWCI